MENEAYKNFKFNVTPINKYAKHHTNDMKQIKKHFTIKIKRGILDITKNKGGN